MSTDGATLTPEPEQGAVQTQEQDVPQTEDEQVLRYRLERFRSLGYSGTNAQLLAVSSADWHDVAAWIAAGCPLETAERIAL
jgi:hypothetical protein